MIDITAHIRELLFRHDCVILPSFGGFIGNYRPARIDRSSSTFSPPVKAISFNRNLTHNDGLLIGKISEERNIGYADSRRIVEDFVDSIITRLNRGERVAFERIGYFQLNDEGNTEFEPDRDENFLLDSYGLGSFRREAVHAFSPSGRISRDMDPVRSSARKMAWRAAIAVPLLAAMIFVPLKTDLFTGRASMNPISGLELPDTEIVITDTETETPVIEETKETTPAIVEETEVIAESTSSVIFQIVAGSFQSHENARRMVDEAISAGYRATLSENESGYYRVILDSFNSREDALKLREQARAVYSDCWLLTK